MLLVLAALADPFQEYCAGCHNQGGAGGAGPTAGWQTPALFGVSLLATVPEEVLEVMEADGHGDVGWTEAGAGRFGWTALEPTIAGIVSRGCEGGPVPEAEVPMLLRHLDALGPPVELSDTPGFDEGKVVFARIGCAGCHRFRVGDVDGAYTDLLLHEMGRREMRIEPPENFLSDTVRVATAWRTPPLWGLRDSAPYWHDGASATIELAIQRHAGEGLKAADAFHRLLPHDRNALLGFLHSLAAP